jgi:hypothetical protein
MKKIIGIFIVILLIVTTLKSVGMINENNPLDGGWIEVIDGIKILHLEGSNYEMGYQHGYLLKDEIGENFQAWIYWGEQLGFSYDDYLSLFWRMYDYIPQNYIEELQGMADGSGLSLNDIFVFNVIAVFHHCCGVAAWGPATKDGRLIHARSHDYSLNIVNPETGKYIHENAGIIVRKPNFGYGSIGIAFHGAVFAADGLNEKKVAIGLKSSWSNDRNKDGYPIIFRIREAIDYASTTDEAIDIITSGVAYSYNLIISDGDESKAYVVEQTANELYIGTWNDSTESNSPFWEIDHVIRRTNIFINYETAAAQRDMYDPSRLPLLMMFLKQNVMGEDIFGIQFFSSVPWMHYYALSKAIEEQWGNIDLNSMMNILRDVYSGKTDWRFSIVNILGTYPNMAQWVAYPETGDYLFSAASSDKQAYENPVHQFNMFELLNSEPP